MVYDWKNNIRELRVVLKDDPKLCINFLADTLFDCYLYWQKKYDTTIANKKLEGVSMRGFIETFREKVLMAMDDFSTQDVELMAVKLEEICETILGWKYEVKD